MTEQWVLSIIAEPPPELGMTSTQEPDGSDAIGDIVAALSTAAAEGPAEGPNGPGYRTEVARAAYVADIQTALYNFKAKRGFGPDIIQLIAHGSPGRLQFGGYWSRKAQDPVLGFAVLDSNPDSYGTLFEYIPPKARVFLLGCNVGSSAPSGYVASGKALLFDLEDMMGADVYAADDLVHPGLFTNGLYQGSLVTSSGKPANPAVLPFVPNHDRLRDPKVRPMPTLRGVRSAPALGFHPQLEKPDSSLLGYFQRYVYAQPQPPKLLAMSEIEFVADGDPVRVDAICGLRYVRVQARGEGTAYYEPPQVHAPGPDNGGRRPDPTAVLKGLKTEYRAQRAAASAAPRA